MSDVIGRALVLIAPDFAGFRPAVNAEMEAVASQAARKFNSTFASSLKGLKPALEEIAQQVKLVDTAVDKIDGKALSELGTKASKAGADLADTSSDVKLLDRALESVDSEDLEAVARAAGLASDSLGGTTSAARATNSALDAIDVEELAKVATTAATAGGALDEVTEAALGTINTLDRIDPSDLFDVTGAAQAAASALDGTAASAVATDSALAAIDSGDLTGVATAAGGASAALEGTATAAVGLDAALATVDAVDVAGVTAAATTATAALGGTAAAAGLTSAQLAGLKTFGLAGAGALGLLAAAGVNIAGNLEQAQIAFTGLLGSKDEADAFLATLKDFASTTPFEFEQVLPATQKLIALGQTGEDAIATLTTIGNAAAAVGASGESIDGVVTAIAQIQAKGKLQAEELNQIAERLPNFNRGNFYTLMGEALGVTSAEVQSLQQSGELLAKDAIPVLLQALDEVPGALGAMDRQSVTLKGRLSTLADNVKFGLAEAFTDLGNRISPTLEPLGKSLNTALKDVGSAVAEIASKVLPVIIPMIDQLGPVLSGALQGLSVALGPVVAAFGVMLRVVAPVAATIAPFASALLGLAGTVFIAHKALGAFLQVSALFKSVLPLMTKVAVRFSAAMKLVGAAAARAMTLIAAHPFVAVAAVIAGLFILMWRNSEKLREAVGNLGRVIMAILGPAIDFVRNALGNLLNIEFTGFGSILEWLGDRVAVFVQFLAEGLLKTLAAVRDMFSAYVMPVMRVVGTLVGEALSAVGGAISSLMPILSAVGGFFANVVTQAGNLWAVLTSGREVADGVGEVLDNVFGNTGRLIDPISNVITQVGNLWGVFRSGEDVAQGVGEILDNIFGNTGTFVGPIRSVTDSLIGLWDILKNFAGAVFDVAIQPLIDVFNVLVAVVGGDFSGALDIGREALGNFAESVTRLPGALLDVITGLATSAGVIVEEGRKVAAQFLSGLLAEVIEMPFVGPMVAALKAGVDAVFQNLGGVFDIVGGLLTWDTERITSGVTAIFEAIKTQFTVAIPNLLAGLTDLFSDILPPAFNSMVESVRDIPILGDIAVFVLEAVKGGFEALGGLSDLLGGLLTFDTDRILSGLGGIATGIATWISELPAAVFSLLGNTANGIALVSEWVSGWFAGLGDMVRGIPILGDLAGLVLDTISGAFDVVGGLGDIIAGLFTFDLGRVGEGLGGIVGAIGDFLVNLPAAIIGYVGDLGELLGTVLSGAAEWIADNAPKLFDALKDLPEILGNIIAAAFSGIGGLIGDLFGNLFGSGGEVDKAGKKGAKGGGGEPPAENDNPIVAFFKGLFGGAVDWITNKAVPTLGSAMGDFATRLPGILGNIFGGIVKIVATVVPGLLGLFVDWLGDLAGLLFVMIRGAFNFVVDKGPSILVSIGKWLATLPGVLLGFLGDLAGVLAEWLGGAWDRVAENAGPFLSKLGSWLATLPATLLGFLGDFGGALLGWVATAFDFIVTNGPSIIGGLLGFIASLPIRMLGALANLGITLLEWVANGFYWVVTEGPGAITDFLGWIASIPAMIIDGLGALGGLLVGWAKTAFKWIADNGTDILSAAVTWVAGVPGQLVSSMAFFGQLLWDWAKAAFGWIVTNGVDILTGVVTWATGVPGKLIAAMAALGSLLWNWAKNGFKWIVTKGADVLSAVARWAAGVPGRIVGFLGNLGTRIFEWARGAFNTVRDRGPEVIRGLVDFFTSIPGRLFGALRDGVGVVGDIASDIGGSIWNAIKGSLDDVFDGIRNREVSVGPLKFKPFSFLPDLMAEGGIVTRATQAIIGEAGPEVVIPLSNPQRAKELVVQSGLLNIIRETPTSVTAATPGAVDLPIPTPPQINASGPATATLNVPAVNVPAGLAISAPPASVDTAPVAQAATTSMADVVASATSALAPLPEWFASFPTVATTALSAFGPTVWTAVKPSFEFFVNSALTELDRLVAFMTAFIPLVVRLLALLGPRLWAAVAPGLRTLRTSIEAVFNGLSSFVTTWQANLKRGLEGLPAWAGGIGTQIVNALGAPFRSFASATWNPFAAAMNVALDQIPATASITIPSLPTAHSGGIVGDRLPETGGPLSASEMVVKMRKGEGVLPTEAMAKLDPYEFEALRSGNIDRLATRFYGERDPRKDEMGDGVPYSPTPSERNFNLIPDTVVSTLDLAVGELKGNVEALKLDPLYTAKLLGGTTDKVMTEGTGFVRSKVDAANAAALKNLGGVGTAFPVGVPAGLGPAIEMMRAWKGRSGSSQAILRYFDATGVPGRATSIFRPGAVTRGSGGRRASLHSLNRAVDFAGPTPSRDSPELLRIYNAFAPVASILAERIYSGPGGGYVRNPITRADHHDHVHIGLAVGGIVDRLTDALIGEDGPEARVRLDDVDGLTNFLRTGRVFTPIIDTPTLTSLGAPPEVVLPLSNPERAQALARQALGATASGRAALADLDSPVLSASVGNVASASFGSGPPSGLAVLERPRREVVDSGPVDLLDVLERTRQTPIAPATLVPATSEPVGERVPFDGGPFGGGPGNTYHITGVSLDQVRAEIEARDEATMRKRR